jgi:predicted RNase H-like HicB family nuclease
VVGLSLFGEFVYIEVGKLQLWGTETGRQMKTFTAYIEFDAETQLYVGIVPGIPGAHTQTATLDELQKNLKEVLELCLVEFKGQVDDLPRFVGLQQLEVAV